jgi:hypothetical protein
MNNCEFLWRKKALTEGVFAIPLFETTTMLDRQADQKTETVETKNRGKPIALRPITALTISKQLMWLSG